MPPAFQTPALASHMHTLMNRHLPARHRVLIAAIALLEIGVFGACSSKLLDVQSPSRIPAASLENPANAQLLVNGAIADFECAVSSYIVAGGLIGQELDDGTQTADRYPYDRRTVTNQDLRYQTSSCTAVGVYSPLQTARVSADNVRRLLMGWTDQEVPGRATLLARANVYEAYSMIFFAEGFCATVFSHFNADGSITYGDSISPAMVLDSSIAYFDAAIAGLTGSDTASVTLKNLAYAGRARAKLDKGDLAGARSDATQVASGFRYNITASTSSTRRQNRVWSDNGVVGGGAYNTASSVGPIYRALNDPRVTYVSVGRVAAGTGVPLYAQTKYTTASSSIRLASHDEAQLIIAESNITANPASAIAIVNTFRARGGETPLLPTATATEIRDAIINERRREFFLEGQHLGDLIRYDLPFNPAVGAAYPGGGNYGSQRCLPLPSVETLNNPNFRG